MQIIITNIEINQERKDWMNNHMNYSINVQYDFLPAVEGKLLEKDQLNETGFKIIKSHPVECFDTTNFHKRY